MAPGGSHSLGGLGIFLQDMRNTVNQYEPHNQNASVQVKVGIDSHTIIPSDPFGELLLPILITFYTTQGEMLPPSVLVVLMICKLRCSVAFWDSLC